jgi:hypothetical protein
MDRPTAVSQSDFLKISQAERVFPRRVREDDVRFQRRTAMTTSDVFGDNAVAVQMDQVQRSAGHLDSRAIK